MIYLELFFAFLQIGAFSFGGGYAAMPLIQSQVIDKYGWLSTNDFSDLVTISQMTPGPIAVNMATYVGQEVNGVLGAFIATIGVILPSFLIILLIASILNNFIQNKYVQYFLKGIKAVTVALILATGVTLMLSAIGINNIHDVSMKYTSIICIIIALVISILYKLIRKKKMNTILFIVLCAIIGIIVCVIAENIH